MTDINNISISGWVEHLRITPDKTSMFLEVYQNVFGNKLTKYIVVVPKTMIDEVRKLKIRKNDRILIADAKTYSKDGQILILVTSPGQISVIERSIKDQGEVQVEEFI